MNRIVVESKIGSDGVLHLDLPLGVDHAQEVVRVTIETLAPPTADDEWRRAILSTAGKWRGELERPDQGEYEVRESFH